MYNLITDISQRCYDTATKRGKDTSCVGCVKYLCDELSEYWHAVDAGRITPDLKEVYPHTYELSDEEFTVFYDSTVHNTTLDELADILITAASWTHAAKLCEDKNSEPGRAVDYIMAKGAVRFVYEQIAAMSTAVDVSDMFAVIDLKMRYNKTRNK